MLSQRLIARPSLFRARLLAIAAALLVAELVWVLAGLALGTHLQAPAGTVSPQPVDIGPLEVAIACVVLSLVGWAMLAGLERLTRHARRIWLVVALVALAASLTMPLSGTGVSPVNRIALVLIHVVVAAVLIPLLYRTSTQRTARVSRVRPSVAQSEAA